MKKEPKKCEICNIELTECTNKDTNGNACWNCENDEGGCGTAEDE